jgi:hypothetical protein
MTVVSKRPDGTEVPYYYWDRQITIDEIAEIVASPGHPERVDVIAHLLREARPDEVWQFMTPADVVQSWPEVSGRLGRRRPFWEWVLSAWREMGLLA